MHRDGWIVLAVGGLAVYYFYLKGHATGAAGLPAGVNPLGDLFNTGGAPTPPATDTGNGGATGSYGTTTPTGVNPLGDVFTGKPGLAGDTVDKNGPIYSPPNRQVVF